MRYHKPSSFEEAVSIAKGASGTTRFLAGGTDVLVQLRADILCPDDLIDIKSIPDARQITRREDGGWTIGCAVSGAEMTECAALVADWPGLAEGMDLIGSTQVQGRATLVGNLCNASPAADSVPAMMAAGATVSIIGPNGPRDVAVADIPVAPGKTQLAQGEVIVAVNIPPRGAGGGDAYQRFIPRTEMDIAVVGCGINLRVENARITEAQVALGAVAPTALLVPQAAQAIIGSKLEPDALNALASAAQAACNPIDDKRGTVAFRVHVAGVLAKRTAQRAYDRAMGKEVAKHV